MTQWKIGRCRVIAGLAPSAGAIGALFMSSSTLKSKRTKSYWNPQPSWYFSWLQTDQELCHVWKDTIVSINLVKGISENATRKHLDTRRDIVDIKILNLRQNNKMLPPQCSCWTWVEDFNPVPCLKAVTKDPSDPKLSTNWTSTADVYWYTPANKLVYIDSTYSVSHDHKELHTPHGSFGRSAEMWTCFVICWWKFDMIGSSGMISNNTYSNKTRWWSKTTTIMNMEWASVTTR